MINHSKEQFYSIIYDDGSVEILFINTMQIIHFVNCSLIKKENYKSNQFSALFKILSSNFFDCYFIK